MSFFKKYKEKKQFNNDLMIAKMRNEPLFEGVMSVIYSVHKDELNFLVLERSKEKYPWPGMRMYGVIGKKESNDNVRDIMSLIKENIAPNVNNIIFNKIVKNINFYEKLNFNIKDEFQNVGVEVYLTEIDDYILRSCRGFKNDNIQNSYYVRLEDLFKQIQSTKIYHSEIMQTIQPHFAHVLWLDNVHKEIMSKYFGKVYLPELLF